jgi:hypothetical protein
MRNKFLSVLFIAVLGWMMISSTTSSGGKSGKTGAPGENDCTQCHGGSAVNSGVGTVSLSTGITAGYDLSATYNMSVSVNQVGISLFGFSIVALDANGASVGNFVAGTDNHIEFLTVSGNNRQYVTHNSNGGASAGSHTFGFSWVAPSSDVGDVTFYVSANASNGNGGTSGDFIYTTSSTVSAMGGGGSSFVINEINPDPSEVGADTTEFVELYGTPGMSLDGYVMVCFNGGTGTNNVSYGAYDLDGYSIPASGYFVIGNPLVPNVNYIVPLPTAPAAFLQNGPDAVGFYLGNATDWPNGTVATNVNLVDAVVYGTNDPDATVLLSTLTPGQLQVNESGGNIEPCMARVPDGGLPFVTSSFVEQLPTPGATNSSAGVAGCTDMAACNYNPLATISDASCLFLGFPCDDGNAITSNDVITADCACAGTQTTVSWTFRVDMSTTTVNAPGVYIAGTFQGWVPNQDLLTDADGDNVWEITFPALPTNTPIEYKFLNGIDGWESSPELANCGVDDLFGAFNRADTTGVINEVLPVVCFNSCSACVTTDVPGCTDITACNFNSAATTDDGSCIDPSMWYLDADNDGYYVDDSLSCGAPNASYTATMGVMGDCNDAVSTINAAGTEICGNGSDEDCSGADLACGVPGCTDVNACNYNPLATSNDGSCVLPTMWYLDADNDGYYVDDSLACAAPSVDYTAIMGIDGDCDDVQSSINAGASEICDELDNDCDQEIDEFVQNVYYLDADADGFGDVNSMVLSCQPVVGYVDNGDDCDDALLLYQDNDGDSFGGDVLAACGELSNADCDDASGTIYPGAFEFCENTIDENCDGVDDVCTGIPGCTNVLACNFDPLAESDNGSCSFGDLWYLDTDGDGFASGSIESCNQPSANHTITVLPITDCDDNDASINSNAAEVCGNGIDENCDGTDEVCIVSGCTDATACNYNPSANNDDGSCAYAILWYLDADADGFALDTISDCIQPNVDYTSIVLPLGDCNDNDASINAGATEICGNDIDEDCSGTAEACAILGCTDPEACNFESTATEDDSTCTYSVMWYLDMDQDGFASDTMMNCSQPGPEYTDVIIPVTDCDDMNPSISPISMEICGNGIDDDCINGDAACVIDGCTDAAACNYNPEATSDDSTCFYSTMWYLDADGDGYYSESIDSCYAPSAEYTTSAGISGDCNDQDASINASEVEVCNDGIDNNCNGMVDETTGSTWYQDADADGFGNPAVDSVSCDSPVGFVLNSLDCDDDVPVINPNGVEICGNGIDEDCNGDDLLCDLVGCTDINACNYDALAVISDGSCYYIGEICDDGNANTINDEIQNDCVCYGYVAECATNPIVISLDSLHNVSCFGGNDGYIQLSVDGGNGPFFASWNSFPIQTTPYATGLSAGTYTFTVEDTDGCLGTFTQEITQPDGSLPVVSGNNDVDPADNEQYIVNAYPGCTYTWTVSNGLILSGQDNDTLNVLWNDASMGTIYVYQTDTLTGCQLMDGLAVYINAVGTDELSQGAWKWYPNPASDWVNLEGLALNAEVKLFDATGRLMHQFIATESLVKLNVQAYESGVYFIQVKDDFGWRTERMIKQ